MMSRVVIALVLGVFLLNANLAEARKRKTTSYIQEMSDSLATPPKDNEVCFAPDEPCAGKLSKFILSATTSLDIAIYDINEDQVVHAILSILKKVSIRIVVDKKQSKGNHSKVALLQQAGVNVRYGYQRGIMHNKFVIVDGKRLETGSFNYTHHAASANQENQVYLSTPEVVSRFKTRFDHIWSTASQN